MRFACFAAALVAALLPFTAYAERATERYAPAQLFVARDLLERARAAAALQEFAAARRYAQQAEVDARLAWGMTDAPALRAQAEAILAEARALSAEADALTRNSRGPPAASYPSPSAQAQADAPSPR